MEIKGLEGIYRAISGDNSVEEEQYIQVAFQPPHKRSPNAGEFSNQYRIIKRQSFDAAITPDDGSSYKVKFLPLAKGFLGVVVKTYPECQFVFMAKEQDYLEFAEIGLREQAVARFDEYEDLVRFGDSWIQKHESRLYVKYGDTDRDLISFFNRQEVWKPFTGMKRQRLIVHMTSDEATKNANEKYRRGLDYLEQKDYSNALAEFKHVVSLKPTLASAYFARGTAHYELQHFKDAYQDFTAAMDIAPEYRDAWMMAGEAATKVGDLVLAFNLFRRASFMDPQDGAPQYAFFSLSVLTGERLSEGSVKCSEAAKLNPSYRSCIDTVFKMDREERARASTRLTDDQQDFITGLFKWIGIGIVLGSVLGSSDDGAYPSGRSTSSLPVIPPIKTCVNRCSEPLSLSNMGYCTEYCY